MQDIARVESVNRNKWGRGKKGETHKVVGYGANIMTKQFEFELCKFELLTSVI